MVSEEGGIQWIKKGGDDACNKIERRAGEMRSTVWSRSEEVVMSRIRFGHTGLNTKLFMTGKHDAGKCDHCREG